MSEILFINACISTGHPSRTLFLARYFLKQLAKNTQSKITEIDLTKENLQPLNEKTLAARKLTLDNDTFENTGKSRFFERRTSRVLY